MTTLHLQYLQYLFIHFTLAVQQWVQQMARDRAYVFPKMLWHKDISLSKVYGISHIFSFKSIKSAYDDDIATQLAATF